MAYSTQEVVSDGTLTLLDISIGYFEREDITVYFDGVPNAYPWAWVGTTQHTIEFVPAVPAGVVVLLRRDTDIDQPRHIFSLGAQFTSQSLDEAILQVLRIAQEAREGGWGESTSELREDLALPSGSVLVGHTPASGPNTSVHASLITLMGALGAVSVGHTPSGAGATATTVGAQLRFIQSANLNIKDAPFYAVGDGVADDTAAFELAIASIPGGGRIYVPRGWYRITRTLYLHSGVTFYGDGCTNLTFGAPTNNERPSHIFIDSNTLALFKHPLDVQMETIRFTDVSIGARLYPNTTPRGTATGFEFIGSYPHDIKHMTFERCQFSNFGGYAMRVLDPNAGGVNPDWNVCPVTIDDCAFYYNTVGIELEADNADYWMLRGTAFFQGTGTYGINCKRSGVLSLDQCFGGGGTMVITSGTIRDSLIFNSCQYEGATAMLHVADTMATQNTYRPIVMNNCIIEAPVLLAAPCHFSSNNSRYVDNVTASVAGVVLEFRGDSFLPTTTVSVVYGSAVRTFMNHGADLPLGIRGQITDGKCIQMGAAPPVSGKFAVGDITYNSAPAAGAPTGWICTAAGTPGTWGILGYMEGAGKSVTQLTSKGTNVTNNALSGQIVTASDSIGAGVLIAFNVANSFVTNKDSISYCLTAGANDAAYDVKVTVFDGGFVVYIKNSSAGAIAEALKINFKVHKSTF